MTKKNSPSSKLLAAAQQGDVTAQCKLADLLREGDGMPQNLEAALLWYRQAAATGDPEAMNNLGSMLLNGIGCEADAKASVPWFEAAAEKGNAVAQFNLGLRYLHGSGVEQDDEKAEHWIARSAEQHHPEALGELGTIYRFGRGTESDLVQACELHMLAARLGDAVAHGNLADYHDELATLAIEGNRQVAFALCHMYDWGIGMEKNPALTWAWLRWAHDGCEPMPDDAPCAANINTDVAEAFRFFRRVVKDKNVIDEGEARLSEWLIEAGIYGIGTLRPILSVITAGGRITLKGRWIGGPWQFLREVDDQTPELIDEPVISHLSHLTDTWRGALKLMDQYPWHCLVPTEVHPEFAKRVWQAYQRRWERSDNTQELYRDQWKVACGRRSEEEGSQMACVP